MTWEIQQNGQAVGCITKTWFDPGQVVLEASWTLYDFFQSQKAHLVFPEFEQDGRGHAVTAGRSGGWRWLITGRVPFDWEPPHQVNIRGHQFTFIALQGD